MSPRPDAGRRLIVSLIDKYAKDTPDRAWASVPIDNDELTKGFRDITYREFANAINHAAHWLDQNVKIERVPFQTIAYAGPKDIRYPILACAAAKCQIKLLLCSPFASAAAQTHLLKATNCNMYMHSITLGPLVRSVVEPDSGVLTLEIPELDQWLSKEEANPYPYTKTWDEAESDPWLIFHTSGTTGLPKPVVYTNWMMTSFDAAELMPDAHEMTINRISCHRRCFVSLPTLHFVGMTIALQFTTFLGGVCVTGPPGPVTGNQVVDILNYGKAETALMPPSQIEDVTREPDGISTLERLECVFFVGSPMPKNLAEKLIGHVKFVSGMGSTEAGGYFLKDRDDDEWNYYTFRPAMGVVFEKRTDDLYELVFKRQPHLERWQQLFKLYPDLTEFPTKDLFAPHPTRPDLWRYSGRVDDLVILGHGEGLYATGMEEIIQKHPEIKTALIGGQGRSKPFLIIELRLDASLLKKSKEERLEVIWPYVEEANEQCSDYVKIIKNLVTFSDPTKPFPLTGKETVLRRPAFELYEPEIEHMYSSI